MKLNVHHIILYKKERLLEFYRMIFKIFNIFIISQNIMRE